MGGTGNTIIFFLYLIFGIYFLNAPFEFIPLPEIGSWIIFTAGIFLLFGGMKYLRSPYFGFRSSPMGY